MDEVRSILHDGARIIRIEYPDGSDLDSVLKVIEEAKRVISGQPEGSVLTLTIIGDFNYNTAIARAFEEYIKHNKPYVKAAAVLGVKGLRKALYNSYMVITHRSLKIFDREEEALDFLAASR